MIANNGSLFTYHLTLWDRVNYDRSTERTSCRNAFDHATLYITIISGLKKIIRP